MGRETPLPFDDTYVWPWAESMATALQHSPLFACAGHQGCVRIREGGVQKTIRLVPMCQCDSPNE